VRLRELLAIHEELRRKIESLEKSYDSRFQALFCSHPAKCSTLLFPARRRIGFHAPAEPLPAQANPSDSELK
jgi:hypothetical protein